MENQLQRCPREFLFMISILLVDDALDSPHSIRGLLSSASNNFELHCATTYREIVDAFRSEASDVCLIDSEIESGLKLFAQARSLGYTAPIVLVTPNDAREAINAIRQGASDCLIRDDLSAAGIEHSICYVVEQARNSSLQRQRERRYLALLDNASSMVYTLDLEGNFTSMNRIGEQMIGYSHSELREMNLSQLVAPEYRILVEKLIARTLDAQAQTTDEVELITKYGDKLMVEIKTHPINRDGKSVELQVVATISAQPAKGLPWESRSLIEDSRPRPVNEENRSLRSSSEARRVLPKKHSPASGRSQYIF
jgi:PAS domain S-box-containing protein